MVSSQSESTWACLKLSLNASKFFPAGSNTHNRVPRLDRSISPLAVHDAVGQADFSHEPSRRMTGRRWSDYGNQRIRLRGILSSGDKDFPLAGLACHPDHPDVATYVYCNVTGRIRLVRLWIKPSGQSCCRHTKLGVAYFRRPIFRANRGWKPWTCIWFGSRLDVDEDVDEDVDSRVDIDMDAAVKINSAGWCASQCAEHMPVEDGDGWLDWSCNSGGV